MLDNLSRHRATDVLLFSRAHPRWEFVFPPKDAASLTLIAPWWQALRSLAVRGQRFEPWAESEPAVADATTYGNAHRHPCSWGRRRRHRVTRHGGLAALPNVA